MLHGTKNYPFTSPHNLELAPIQINFSNTKNNKQTKDPKKRCLACRKMGYNSCQCHLVAQGLTIPNPTTALPVFIPDNKSAQTKPKRKYTRKINKEKTINKEITKKVATRKRKEQSESNDNPRPPKKQKYTNTKKK